MGRAARRWRVTGAGAWVLSLGVGVLGPEGASWEGRRFGTGPSFVWVTDGAGSSAVAGDWSGGMRRAKAARRRAATQGVLSLGVGLLGPEGASWEGRRFGTGPSF